MKNLFLLILILGTQSLSALSDTIPYLKAKGLLASNLVRSKKSYNLYDLDINTFDPGNGEPMIVHVHFFENKKGGKLPLLVIVPPINGISAREKNVSEHFIKCGYHTVVIEPVKSTSNINVPIQEFQKNLLSFVGAVRSTIDIFSEKEQVDIRNIFIWGASMGAIHSSFVISIDKRINAAILIAGGTSIGDIVAESTQKRIVKYRSNRMNAEHLSSVEDFRKKLKESMNLDVSQFSQNREASDLFFVIALKDKIVPTKYQIELAHAFKGEPFIKECNGGHMKALLRSHLSGLTQFSDFTNSKLKK
ncbi:MAG: hypothetical protein K0S44_2064 [Bacteroidetes bacterium]|nr:hypothetical protein [Bacteroidota bacterium]